MIPELFHFECPFQIVISRLISTQLTDDSLQFTPKSDEIQRWVKPSCGDAKIQNNNFIKIK
jgi:hypothetical protein